MRQNRKHLYTAKTVKSVCGVTARKLDYWIDTDILRPEKVVERQREDGSVGRKTYLFTFANLVQARTVKALRSSGVSLQEIRKVVAHLRKSKGGDWQDQWLVTDGNRVYVRDSTDEFGVLEHLGSGDRQLVFAVVAMQDVTADVEEGLDRQGDEPVRILDHQSVRDFRLYLDARARP